jgi:hypothetical protein
MPAQRDEHHLAPNGTSDVSETAFPATHTMQDLQKNTAINSETKPADSGRKAPKNNAKISPKKKTKSMSRKEIKKIITTLPGTPIRGKKTKRWLKL